MIEKTTQALDRWRTIKDASNDSKVPALQQALDKLKQELQELDTNL